MKLNKKVYFSKLKGCFIGKNIGGTLGGPFEGKRELLDIKGFTTKKGEPLPNDDLDLQMVWLQAIEDQGPQHIDSEVLGEYWLSFITPYWNEYGICKANMHCGIMPSVAGDMENNIWKHSNGAWIRTEIWASIAPGAVDTAVRYATEDALVDHGMGEGTYAAIFVAALESAAYFESDVNRLIDIGLSKVNPSSRLHSTIELVRKEYQEGLDYKEVRNHVVALNQDIGDGWFQAPNNIAFVVIGLLYGQGDFKKSMLTAVNCGDDTDCTAATIGSILGIILGEENIPSDWKEYIGNQIVTCSINKGVSFRFAYTIDDLISRIAFQAQYALYANKDHVEIVDGNTEISEQEKKDFSHVFNMEDRNTYTILDERDDLRALRLSLKKNTFKVRTGALTTIVSYLDGDTYEQGEKKTIDVMAVNNIKAFGNQNYQANLELILPEGVHSDIISKDIYLPCWTPLSIMAYSKTTSFHLSFDAPKTTPTTVLIKVTAVGRGKSYYVPVVFLRK